MPSQPSRLEDHLGFWLRRLSNDVSSSFAARLERHGVSVAQWVALRLLYDRPGCSLVDLAEALALDKGATSRMIDRLIKAGLALRENSAKNRREIALSLTPRAMDLVPRLAEEADENDRKFFEILTGRQRREFQQLVKRLVTSNTGAKPAPPLH